MEDDEELQEVEFEKLLNDMPDSYINI